MLTNKWPMINKKGIESIKNEINQLQIQQKCQNRAQKTESYALLDQTGKKMCCNRINSKVSQSKYQN